MDDKILWLCVMDDKGVSAHTTLGHVGNACFHGPNKFIPFKTHKEIDKLCKDIQNMADTVFGKREGVL